jgi:hypothetical protein
MIVTPAIEALFFKQEIFLYVQILIYQGTVKNIMQIENIKECFLLIFAGKNE